MERKVCMLTSGIVRAMTTSTGGLLVNLFIKQEIIVGIDGNTVDKSKHWDC
jgi:hypothetical protein